MSATAPANRRTAPSLGCGYFIVGVLALGGLGCLLLALSNYQDTGPSIPPAVWAPVLIGLGLLAAAKAYAGFARRLVREHGEDERRRADHPDEPWLWERAWLGDRIEADDRKGLGLLWFFTVAWNSIAFAVLFQLLREPPREKAAYIALLFPLVGLGLLSGAVYLTIRARKYGRARFAPVSLPGVIGGHLGGVIEVPGRVVALGDLRLCLRCLHKKTTGSGKQRRVVENTLWEAEERIPPERQLSGPAGTEIPVLFAIPPGRAATSLDDPNDQIIWRLSAEAETPGVDFATTFSVPVFPVGDAATVAAPRSASEAAHLASVAGATDPDAPALDAATLARAGVERRIDGWSFRARPLRAARWISTAILAGLLALLGVLMLNDAPVFAWAVTTVFALVALLMSYDLWHDRFTLRRVGDELVVTDTAWFRRRDTRVPRGDIADLRLEKSVSVGATQYYRLLLVGRPVGDPPCPAGLGEPFRTRKQRRHLARALPHEAAAIRARLAALPRFELRCAGHLPGLAFAERLRAEILGRLTS